MSFEEKFYKTIANNELIAGDKTRHPDSLTEKEVEEIWRKEKQQAISHKSDWWNSFQVEIEDVREKRQTHNNYVIESITGDEWDNGSDPGSSLKEKQDLSIIYDIAPEAIAKKPQVDFEMLNSTIKIIEDFNFNELVSEDVINLSNFFYMMAKSSSFAHKAHKQLKKLQS